MDRAAMGCTLQLVWVCAFQRHFFSLTCMEHDITALRGVQIFEYPYKGMRGGRGGNFKSAPGVWHGIRILLTPKTEKLRPMMLHTACWRSNLRRLLVNWGSNLMFNCLDFVVFACTQLMKFAWTTAYTQLFWQLPPRA